MKRKVVTALLLAAVCTAQGAGAKTLEEVLKEKGVITEADYAEVTKSKAVTASSQKPWRLPSATPGMIRTVLPPTTSCPK
ncbi:hypothetical protein [Geomonas sp.]|uniref:hypothetical protein n=1 Tax=Geomonas sp. TaxID=2651584 RepID=UPI002B49E6A4|nr:hypothetical protein [Geomonas sp.]HJV35401.1 hypothetical protein [Geomonas sp.]